MPDISERKKAINYKIYKNPAVNRITTDFLLNMLPDKSSTT